MLRSSVFSTLNCYWSVFKSYLTSIDALHIVNGCKWLNNQNEDVCSLIERDKTCNFRIVPSCNKAWSGKKYMALRWSKVDDLKDLLFRCYTWLATSLPVSCTKMQSMLKYNSSTQLLSRLAYKIHIYTIDLQMHAQRPLRSMDTLSDADSI